MNLTLKKKNDGFSLVEVMMTVTIIAILSTTVTMSISKYVLERKGEAPVMAFYSQLQQMKAFSQRDNDRYLVVLNPSAADKELSFEIYRDFSMVERDEYDKLSSSHYDISNDKKVQLFVDQENIAKTVRIISPSNVGASGTIDDYTVGGDAIVNPNTPDPDGGWKSITKYVVTSYEEETDDAGQKTGGYEINEKETKQLDNTIIFENDEISTISKGAVFLKNNSADKICYAIIRPQEENNLRLYKWNGSAWKRLD
jgi:prepilin-type N-terminal cleavage/methylation domain-containing protein